MIGVYVEYIAIKKKQHLFATTSPVPEKNMKQAYIHETSIFSRRAFLGGLDLIETDWHATQQAFA